MFSEEVSVGLVLKRYEDRHIYIVLYLCSRGDVNFIRFLEGRIKKKEILVVSSFQFIKNVQFFPIPQKNILLAFWKNLERCGLIFLSH